MKVKGYKKDKQMVISRKVLNHRHHTWYIGTIQKMTSNDISFLDLDERSRSYDKVKGYTRGGVCVL